MVYRSLIATLVVCAGLLTVNPGNAQDRPADWPWKPVALVDGLDIKYLFYREADNENNGIVIKLKNTGGTKLTYRFQIVFRSEDSTEVVDEATGALGPFEMKTGDLDGLFWIPFEDGREVYEVGLRRVRIEREDAGETHR